VRDDATITRNREGAGVRARFERLRVTRRRSALGLPEIAALAVAALVLLAAILSYLFLLAPQRSRVQALAAEREGLERQSQGIQTNLLERKDTQESVREILSSLEDFEISHLGQSGSGVRTVIEEMNRLIIKNRLRISGGVQYTQLQETAPGAAEQPRQPARGGEEGGARVVQSIFPGIGVTLTAEGSYPNLRRFIRDIEADRRQFVVINSVELEGVSDTGPRSGEMSAEEAAAVAATPPEARGKIVSLRLDMAAYFRRAAAATQ
jgi:Tfp pilus assembly protein PilO